MRQAFDPLPINNFCAWPENHFGSSETSVSVPAGTVVIDLAKAGDFASPSSVMPSFSSCSAPSGSSANGNKPRSSEAMTPCLTRASKLMI